MRFSTPAPMPGAAALSVDEHVELHLEPLLQSEPGNVAMTSEAEKQAHAGLGKWGMDVIALAASCTNQPPWPRWQPSIHS